jgi:ABC-type molybdate transport system substrate-binding protein
MQCSAGIRRGITVTVLFLLCATAFFGCGQRPAPRLYVYCNETFWYVMQEEARFFNRTYGFQVVLIPIRAERTPEKTEESLEVGNDRRPPAQWRNIPTGPNQQRIAPHMQINSEIDQQIERIANESFGDLFLSDSQKHLEKLRKTALSINEYPVCYLTLTMVVPTGNPHQFRSIKDVLESKRRLGIVGPTFDGLGEASWKMLGKIIPGGESVPTEFVQIYERQYDLLEALEQGNIDAALVWDATSLISFLLAKYAAEYNAEYEPLMRKVEKNQKKLRLVLQAMYDDLVEQKSFAEEVPLTENPDEHYVTAVRLVALGTTTNYGYCKRFADFMRSNRAKEVLYRFGFVTE